MLVARFASKRRVVDSSLHCLTFGRTFMNAQSDIATLTNRPMKLEHLRTARELYDEQFAAVYKWHTFRTRVHQLREGWTNRAVPVKPQLRERTDYIRRGERLVLYTPKGQKKIAALLAAKEDDA